jgi:octaprenyl-diphosphate synthase
MLNSIDTLQVEMAQLRREQDEVHQQLIDALVELYPPLGELVRAQLAYSFSQWRAGVLLTASLQPVDDANTHQQRIYLSTALEMLYLALHIHKLLLTNNQANGSHLPDRSWTGTIILAGDYCFSRAAILAAQTNNPQVVEIFARTLKTVNEGLLRRLLGPSPLPFDEDTELVGGGLRAATVLAGLEAHVADATIDIGLHFIKLKQPSTTAAKPPNFPTDLQPLAIFQQRRWQALFYQHQQN